MQAEVRQRVGAGGKLKGAKGVRSIQRRPLGEPACFTVRNALFVVALD